MIEFYKMSGSGNDFIIIDNRDLSLNFGNIREFVRKVCTRKLSVGADGVFLIEPSTKADFKWQFYNSDGSTAEMCGNGSRCVARYAYIKGIAGTKMSFETIAGIITAEVNDQIVKVKLTDPSAVTSGEELDIGGRLFFLDSSIPGFPMPSSSPMRWTRWTLPRSGRRSGGTPRFRRERTSTSWSGQARIRSVSGRLNAASKTRPFAAGPGRPLPLRLLTTWDT